MAELIDHELERFLILPYMLGKSGRAAMDRQGAMCRLFGCNRQEIVDASQLAKDRLYAQATLARYKQRLPLDRRQLLAIKLMLLINYEAHGRLFPPHRDWLDLVTFFCEWPHEKSVNLCARAASMGAIQFAADGGSEAPAPQAEA